MASSFAFIPRTVKKKNHLPVSRHAPSASICPGAQVTSESTRVDNSRRTEKSKAQDEQSVAAAETKPTTAARKDLLNLEDLAQLVCLALSDYAIWADVDLRRKIDWEINQDPYDDDIEGNNKFIPLEYLLRHSQVFRLASSSSSSIITQPQTTCIKAIRTYASHLIDVRLIIPSSSFSAFSGNNTAQWIGSHIQSGYELRRKETSSTLSKHGKNEWDALTIYVENIPNQYRTIPGIIKFLNGLLPSSSSLSSSPVPRIQNISLPSHHRDQSDSIPICKGFALATLSHKEDIDVLLSAWSWNRPASAMNSDRPNDIKLSGANTDGEGRDEDSPNEILSPLHVEAAKFGLRVLRKAKWEELRAEYLLYRQELIDEINVFQDEEEARGYGSDKKPRYADEMHGREEKITKGDPQWTNQTQENANDSVGTAGIHPNSAYPPGCLVFVRNIHPDTNKTTLRNLFLHVQKTSVESGIEHEKEDGDGLDYLDYTKGMDCCYVRLRTPLHAQQLVHCLSTTSVIQISGLDASGSSSSYKNDSQSKPIMAENVLGKREEVYWEKVPQKIKRQAVEKALCFVDSSIGDAISGPITGLSEGDGMKRKRELEEHQTHSINFNIHADSVYPSGCLVFIRNLHPETNKTTLRNLFLHARVENGDTSGKKDADGIDYLDYTKGMDCCHVRLCTPLHAQQLVHDLSSNPIVQTTGLDTSGSRLAQPGTSSSDNRIKDDFASASHLKPIAAEQVLGRREEVYWEKVPEKVRKQAVERALSFLHGGGECSDTTGLEVKGNKPKKKRKN